MPDFSRLQPLFAILRGIPFSGVRMGNAINEMVRCGELPDAPTIEDVAGVSRQVWLKYPNVGARGVNALVDALSELGHKCRAAPEPKPPSTSALLADAQRREAHHKKRAADLQRTVRELRQQIETVKRQAQQEAAQMVQVQRDAYLRVFKAQQERLIELAAGNPDSLTPLPAGIAAALANGAG